MALLSANTLFHFTKKNALLDILETGFRPAYSPEFGPDEYSDMPNTPSAIGKIFIPMVCFCDIPLSNVKEHINNGKPEIIEDTIKKSGYGTFGLGMSKRWGIDKGLNPVTYIQHKSDLSISAMKSYIHLMNFNIWVDKTYQDVKKSVPKGEWSKEFNTNEQYTAFKSLSIDVKEALLNLSYVISFLKPYENLKKNKRYYDEKEWRYIPSNRDLIGAPAIPANAPDIDHLFKMFKDNLEKKFMLQFNPQDVDYIIVANDSDTRDIIDRLRELSALMPERYTETEVERLFTRITTCEQIFNDF